MELQLQSATYDHLEEEPSFDPFPTSHLLQAGNNMSSSAATGIRPTEKSRLAPKNVT
jgi:hypothetical protein